MMRRSVIGAVALLGLLAVPVQAQQELLQSCTSNASGYDQYPDTVQAQIESQIGVLCAQVVNSIADLQPSVGIAFTGGNPVQGTGSTLGTRLGLPRVSGGVRGNWTFAQAPQLFDSGVGTFSDASAGVSALQMVGLPLGAVHGTAAFGVTDGFDVAPMIGGIGAVDLIGSASFVPALETIGLEQTIVNYGIGGRVGLLEQGFVAPGISISGMYRRMGEVEFGDMETADPVAFRTDLSAISVRGVVSKGIPLFDVAVGAGYDQFSSNVGFGWTLVCETNECKSANNGDPIDLSGGADGTVSTAAWNMFADVAFNVLIFNLVGELGYQKPTELLSTDALDSVNVNRDQLSTEALGGGRFFGSIGVRVAL